ncbi:hypothetical protein AB0Q95_22265 [Streptomyces sp. NPDC059900]|uniref:hypothetical protein n=1 Tax=Streptomyces sp. NPDC059900 TaxID=3155816 RepID=UPI00342CE55B
MSDAAQPTAAEVRAAAEAVKTALDRHLAAVERRSGEDDPAVYEAFNELAAAAEEYDELLYDRYDEVTPFEIPGSDSDVLPPYQGPEEANALSVLIRRDYAVAEPQRLLAQAQRVADLDADAASGSPAAEAAGSSVHAALGVLFGEFEPDEIASRHKEFGLEEGDSTLWVTAADEPAEPGEWLDAPFDAADPHRVVCRFDVSAVFDDEQDDEDRDDRRDRAGADGRVRVDPAAAVLEELDDVDDADEADEVDVVDIDDDRSPLDADR